MLLYVFLLHLLVFYALYISCFDYYISRGISFLNPSILCYICFSYLDMHLLFRFKKALFFLTTWLKICTISLTWVSCSCSVPIITDFFYAQCTDFMNVILKLCEAFPETRIRGSICMCTCENVSVIMITCDRFEHGIDPMSEWIYEWMNENKGLDINVRKGSWKNVYK